MNDSDDSVRLNAALEGRYSIERQLGEGGMATVYLAHDLKHERKVALKVLKPELAAVVGAARFLAEVKTTANLQHPHILGLYDSGEADGMLFYVMPYVDGESLRDRLDREHQLPVDEAVAIATNVAEALDYAHRNGVIHRDIKPANILLFDGKPVVSDFGIALAVDAGPSGRLTETGLSLGTPHYMSPEQATGDGRVGPPTDLWAMGCVLYEMLAGQPPFEGRTSQAILGKIVTGERAPLTALRPATPPHVDAVVARALEPIPADRFASASAMAQALRDSGHGAQRDTPSGGAGGSGPWRWIALGATGVAAALAAVVLGRDSTAEGLAEPDYVVVAFAEGHGIGGFRSFDVAPDGSFVIYEGPGESLDHLRIRRWGAGLIPSAGPASVAPPRGISVRPVVSPDGRWIVQMSGQIWASALELLPIDGGRGRVLVDSIVDPSGDATWSLDGRSVYFSTAEGIARVPFEGGDYEMITHVDATTSIVTHGQIELLPGSERAVFVGWEEDWLEPRIFGLDLRTGEQWEVTEGQRPRYRDGYLVWGRQGQTDLTATLLAAPFDVDRMELTAEPFSIVEGISRGRYAYLNASLSRNGTLVYTRGGAGFLSEPVWVDREGDEEPIDSDWVFGGANDLALSPDDGQLAAASYRPGTNRDNADYDIWTKDFATGRLFRVTTRDSQARVGWLGADSVLFWKRASGTYGVSQAGIVAGTRDLRRASVDRQDDDVQYVSRERLGLVDGLNPGATLFRSPDSRWLVYSTSEDDIWALRLDSNEPARPILANAYPEYAPTLSPDSRWMAYVSEQTGRHEVWVRPFPDGGRATQLSTEGASEPLWGRHGTEIFYQSDDNEMVAVEVSTDPTFQAYSRQVLFRQVGQSFLTSGQGRFYSRKSGGRGYDVTADGQRFLMIRASGFRPYEMVRVENFMTTVRRAFGG